MATLRWDRIADGFLKRIPDTFVSTFTPGTMVMPASNILTAAQITDYVNRGLLEFFDKIWAAVEGNAEKFGNIFPELIKISDEITLTSGNYTLASPYLDFHKIIGGMSVAVVGPPAVASVPIRIWNEKVYPFAKTEKYMQYQASANNPAMIQLNNVLNIFPQSSTFQIKIVYIRKPLLPTTGGFLVQNGDVDSPFAEHWEEKLIQSVYDIFLKETHETE